MTRWLAIAALLPLGSCDLFSNAQDLFDGLANPLVGLATVIAIEEPDEVELSSTGFEPGTTVTMFLADASNVNDLDQTPVTGATVSVGNVDASEATDGVYTILPTAGLAYVDNASWSIDVLVGEDAAGATIELPEAAAFTVPTEHTIGEPVTLDLAGQGFDAFVGVVIAVSTGEVTWSNEPEDIGDVYNMTHGSGEVGEIIIPGEAFATEDAFLIGVAGLRNTESAGIDNMNTALSTVTAGKLVFEPTTTLSLPI